MSELKQSIKRGAQTGVNISVKVLLFMVPISFGITLLTYFGLIEYVARPFTGIFHHFGLPGNAIVPYITGVLVNGYSAVAIMVTMPLSLKEITILSAMILMAHNMPIESMIQKKAGANITLVIIARLLVSFVIGYVLNFLILDDGPVLRNALVNNEELTFDASLFIWFKNISWLGLKIVTIIISLTIINKVLEYNGILKRISKALHPVMQLFGLPDNSAIQWLSANLFGLVYGAGVILSHDPKNFSRTESNKLHLSIGISHSLIQETMIFAVIGAPLFWITVPRILSAIIAVWLFRLVISLFHTTASKTDLV